MNGNQVGAGAGVVAAAPADGEAGQHISTFRQHNERVQEAALQGLDQAQSDVDAAQQDIASHEATLADMQAREVDGDAIAGMADMIAADQERLAAAQDRYAAYMNEYEAATRNLARLDQGGHTQLEGDVNGMKDNAAKEIGFYRKR